jgi:hypothetical protein
MTSFITRVELHGASPTDYEKLHDAMRRQGFSTTITSSGGVHYRLPTAEYEFIGNASKADVLAKAKTAASSTGRSYGMLVTESAGSMWYGLQQVASKAA